jgi:YHS domain-containing protein
MKRLILSIPILALVLAAGSANARYVNVDRNGLALQGYDTVAYFTDGKPVMGDANITATFDGATYRFASAEHKASFEREPAKYVPQFGGFCAYAVSINKTASIDPNFWEIVDGRLILQHNRKAWDLWHKDPTANLQKADANWPGLVQKNGK